MTMTTDWAPETRDVPDELDPAFVAEPYTDPWNSIMQRLDSDTIKKLARFVV